MLCYKVSALKMFDFDPLETQDVKKKEVIWNEWMFGGGSSDHQEDNSSSCLPIPLDLHTAASLGLYDTVRDLLASDR